MAQLKIWFDDYNSYLPHSALFLLATNAIRGETIGKIVIPTVLEYRVNTNASVRISAGDLNPNEQQKMIDVIDYH